MNYLGGDQPKFAEIIAREPIVASAGMDRATKSSRWDTESAWVLEEVVRCYWPQRFAFTPLR
jgi:hypothetical protein